MALFQPIQQGPSGSSVTPKAEVQDTTASSVIKVAEGIVPAIAGVFQQQSEAKNAQATGVALTAFMDEQSRIAEAAEQGLITPAEAHTRMRSAVNKHAANNPMLLNPILDVQKKYADSQMGQSVDKGSVAYQEKLAFRQAQQKQAADNGFWDVDAYMDWEEKNRLWAEKNQKDNEQLAKLRMEQTRASTDASRASAAKSRAQEKEIAIKVSNTVDLRRNLSGHIDGAIKGFENILVMPGTAEQKMAVGEEFFSKLEANLPATYPQADQGALSAALKQVGHLRERFKDSVTQGTMTLAAKNAIDYTVSERALNMLDDDGILNMVAFSSVAGVGAMSIMPNAATATIKKALSFSPQPKDTKVPPLLDKETSEALGASLKKQAVTPDDPSNQIPKVEVIENQAVNTFRAVNLYKDSLDKADKEAMVKLVSNDMYEAIKSCGQINIPTEVRAKYQDTLRTLLEDVQSTIHNDYLDAADNIMTTTTRGRTTEVGVETRRAVDVIQPTMSNGIFKFTAKDKHAQAAADALNKKYAKPVNTMLRMIAVGNGNTDTDAAMKELEERMFNDSIPEDSSAPRTAPQE